MNFHQLLQQRSGILRTARLANLAYAYARLSVFAGRIAHAGLTGPVSIHPVNPEAGRFCPVLVAHAANQSVVDEHFLDEDVVEFSDIITFLSQETDALEYTFEFEDIAGRVLPWLRRELARGGIAVPPLHTPRGNPRSRRSPR